MLLLGQLTRISRGPDHLPRSIQNLNPRRCIQAIHRLPNPSRASAPQRRVVIVRHQVPITLETQMTQAGATAALRHGVARRPHGDVVPR